jgi:hypothetical protein
MANDPHRQSGFDEAAKGLPFEIELEWSEQS